MRIYSTVENAVILVVRVLENLNISSNTDCIREKVYSWYAHSDVTDPEILAACALEGRKWYPGARYEDMLAARDIWFPHECEEISIWEIEAAQHDAMWW